MIDLGDWSVAGKIRRLVQETDELIYAEICDRRTNPDPTRTDVLSLLLSARDEAGNGLSDAELHDELITLLIAGQETTVTSLAWAFYWMHHLPHVREKLLAEIASYRDSKNFKAIASLPDLNAVCNETLRLYPVAMATLPRRVVKTFTANGL